MNRKIVLGLLISFVFTSLASAQSKDDKRKENFEKFRAKRVAFITERVKLTPEEAEAFWPLCNELQEKKFELNKPAREERRALRGSDKTLTEADYLRFIDTNADIKIKEAQLEKEYLQKFKKVLSPEKIFKYQRAEEEFMRQMFSPKNGKMGDRKSGERADRGDRGSRRAPKTEKG